MNEKKRSGYVRVKPVTQIAIEIMALDMIDRTKKRDISANDALWDWIVEHDPDIAERAKRKAVEEGYSPVEAGFASKP